jgi:hypothetical protein
LRKFQIIASLFFSLFISTNYSRASEFADESNHECGPSASAPEASPKPAAPAPNSSKERLAVGIGVKVSTLGVGADVALPVTHRSNARFGFNAFNYDHTFDKDGVSYKGTLGLRSAQASFDFFPLGGFHLSPGLLIYNGNNVRAHASVPGNQSFTLNHVTYFSDVNNPIGGTGKLDLNRVAPMFLLGFGNLVPRTHRFSVSFEVGMAYQGSPRVKLGLTGNVCDDNLGTNCRSVVTDTAVQSNILAEQKRLNDKASPFQFYPIISLGVGYKF